MKLSKQTAILILNLIYNERQRKSFDSGNTKTADPLKKNEGKSKIARPELSFGGVSDAKWVSGETEKI